MLETMKVKHSACGLVTLPADWLTVAKLLDTERGTRARGFADSIARNTEGRIAPGLYSNGIQRKEAALG